LIVRPRRVCLLSREMHLRTDDSSSFILKSVSSSAVREKGAAAY
jgi:hypothetical protein